jgi:hypothetical protein
MKSRGYKQKQDWERRLLLKIAREELVEGVKEVLKIKKLDTNERIYKLVVRVDTEGEYIVHATVQLTSPNDGQFWRLIDFTWEEVKR